jgi:lysozyme family protein
VKELQRIVGVGVDGIMGMQTLAAVSAYPTALLIEKLCFARLDFVKGLRRWDTFGEGWERRIMGDTPGVQSNDIGVIDRASRLASSSRDWQQIPQPKPAPGKAPEPEKEPSGGVAAVGGGAIATALAGILSALGDLHPAAQVAAIGGLAFAAYAVWSMWRKGELRL